MSPLRSDYLAGVGQVPFAALAVAAIVATAREAGGRRTTALAAALAFVLIPEVWSQVPTAMTDLGLAACLLSSLPFALRLWRARMPGRADLLVFAVAIGLAVGSKYAGVALALPFVAIGVDRAGPSLAVHRPAPPARARVVAVLATGGFWYVRNLLVTGNPFYPVAPPGLPLPSLYGGAEMRAWEYHLPVGDLGALGSMLLAAGIGFAGAAAIAIARQWRSVEAALALALLATFWFVIPYQESRFLFAAFGVAAIAIAPRRRQAARHGRLVRAGHRDRRVAAAVADARAPAGAGRRRGGGARARRSGGACAIRIGVFGRRVTVTARGSSGCSLGLVAGRSVMPGVFRRTPWATTIWPPPGRGSAPTSPTAMSPTPATTSPSR